MPGRSERKAPRVRVFLGEPVLTEAPANAAIAEMITPDRRDLDLEVVRLPEDSIDRVSEALCQVGMFGSGRCVLLKGPLDEADLVDDADVGGKTDRVNRFLSFLETRMPADAGLVIVTPKLDGRSKLYRWLHDHAVIEDLRVERKSDARSADPSSLTDVIVARVRSNGFPVPTAGVVEAILARTGSNVGELCCEIDRLCLSVGTSRALTTTDVAAHVRDAAGAWIFDFVDAICDGRAGPALTLLADLLASGEAPLRLVATLATKVADCLVAARYAASVRLPPPPSSSSTFAKTVYPLLPENARRRFSNPYRSYYVFRVAQSRGYASLRRLHRRLVDLDLSLKSGVGQPRHLMTEFVASACSPGA